MIITYHNFEGHAFTVCCVESLHSYHKKYYLRACREGHLMIMLRITVKRFIFLYVITKKTCKHHSISTDNKKGKISIFNKFRPSKQNTGEFWELHFIINFTSKRQHSISHKFTFPKEQEENLIPVFLKQVRDASYNIISVFPVLQGISNCLKIKIFFRS